MDTVDAMRTAVRSLLPPPPGNILDVHAARDEVKGKFVKPLR